MISILLSYSLAAEESFRPENIVEGIEQPKDVLSNKINNKNANCRASNAIICALKS